MSLQAARQLTQAYADSIVLQIPRGAENAIAIDLILQHIKFRLSRLALTGQTANIP